jgi:hypothetical protein
MQTFLPYDDFARSARVLDYRRLGKQRVETYQLLKALLDPNPKGWVNHPAAKMWRGHELRLVTYGVAICDEWLRRGYRDGCRDKILSYADRAPFTRDTWYPDWLGNEQFHASHRSNLLRKSPEFYSQYGWTESPDLEYIWPVK